MSVRYLSHEEILIIHARIIDATGGLHGVRDAGLVASAANRPKMGFGGKDLYHSIFHKAAAYFESIAKHHVFVDGNKRTAVAVAARFLYLNGFEIIASNHELESFVSKAITEKHSLEKTALWLKKHSRKRSK